MRNGWLGLGVALALGCTPREPTPQTHTEVLEEAPVEVKAEPVAAQSQVQPVPEPEPPPLSKPAAVPAFVVYGENHTHVLPVSSDELVREASGLWVQDDSEPLTSVRRTHVLTRDGARAIGMPECRCPNTGCHLGPSAPVVIDASTGHPSKAPSFSCGCFEGESDVMPPPDPEDFDGEALGPCSTEGGSRVTSLVGGVAYSRSWGWNGACFGGMSVYDALETTLAVVAKPRNITAGGYSFDVVGCHADLFPAEPTRVWPLGPLDRDVDSCESEYPESIIFTLRRGRLWRVEDTVGHAGGDRVVASAEVTPTRCPGPGDPCGRPKAIPALASVSKDLEFWIASDESVALLASGRAYAIHRASGDAAPVERTVDLDATLDLIGVRYHDDATPLLRALDVSAKAFALPERHVGEPRACEPPALHWDDRGVVDRRGGRDWGDVCWKRVLSDEPESAIAACLHGLAQTEEDSVLAALHYNLGRAFELQERTQMAIREYDVSLQLRPIERVRRRRERLAAENEEG